MSEEWVGTRQEEFGLPEVGGRSGEAMQYGIITPGRSYFSILLFTPVSHTQFGSTEVAW